MFAGLVNQAKSAATALVLKYVARASVAIPFVIALGFALTAITVMLVQRFGHVAAYWIMAAGLAAIGTIAAIVVSAREHEQKAAEKTAAQAQTADVFSGATAQAMMQAPLALLGGLSTPGGVSSALKVARILGQNYALVLLLVLIGALFWPNEAGSNEPGETRAPEGDGSRPVDTYH